MGVEGGGDRDRGREEERWGNVKQKGNKNLTKLFSECDLSQIVTAVLQLY